LVVVVVVVVVGNKIDSDVLYITLMMY